METLYAIVRFFQSGGVFMYPILLIFAVGLAIAVERYVYLTVVREDLQEISRAEDARVQPGLATRAELRSQPSEDSSVLLCRYQAESKWLDG